MNIKSFIEEWIIAANSYNTQKYLEFYSEEAILNDPSVGREFIGHSGIKEYFTKYFIGYSTQTEIVKLDISENTAYLEVEFTGDFPEGKIGGSFDFTFSDGKIITLKADLI
jgi:ketosteroid isomerase-like protein